MNQVIDAIKLNGGTPLSSSQLSVMFSLPGHTVRRIVNGARRDGHPICSCSKGYYYSKKPSDVIKTINSLKHRVESIQEVINGLLSVEGVYNEIQL